MRQTTLKFSVQFRTGDLKVEHALTFGCSPQLYVIVVVVQNQCASTKSYLSMCNGVMEGGLGKVRCTCNKMVILFMFLYGGMRKGYVCMYVEFLVLFFHYPV